MDEVRPWRNHNLRQVQKRNPLGVYCAICGDGPYAKVATHTKSIHGLGRSAYLKLHPGAEIMHPELGAAFALEMKLDKGLIPGRPKQSHCQRGHPLRGKNIKPANVRFRTCRQCYNDNRQARRKAQVAASGTRLCKCGCGTRIPKLAANGNPRQFVFGHQTLKRQP